MKKTSTFQCCYFPALGNLKKKIEIVLETLNPFDLGDKWNDFDTKLRNDKISVKKNKKS